MSGSKYGDEFSAHSRESCELRKACRCGSADPNEKGGGGGGADAVTSNR